MVNDVVLAAVAVALVASETNHLAKSCYYGFRSWDGRRLLRHHPGAAPSSSKH